ncbi:hypothetical protein DPMN_031488 [Dreissena polymorpha]|uniref:LRAT domain-containing protein n=1 Tax=Dreissena polymorpha TaxID=45954 RepID=A0A9D4M211_DREPO|nr:hypothetical protein DPMN_031488 [Dreissena polymorpha]
MNGHNQSVLADLIHGDLVEFKRWWGLYSHWAVYKGRDAVIHLAADENDSVNAHMNSGCFFTICGNRFNKAFVRVDDFWDVAMDSKAYKNNSLDGYRIPSIPEEILKRAMDKIGKKSYNILWSNWEDFANFCRYGEEKSDQTENSVTVVGVAALCMVLYGILKR